MRFPRTSGVLLHPTSFPGRYGIGELNDEAYRFIDFLSDAKQSLWQVLPLGPTGYGDSPYQCFSAFAGNPLLINTDKLVDDGVLHPDDLNDTPDFPKETVDYGWVIWFKSQKLRLAHERFREGASELHDAFDQYCQENDWWLDDYAFYAALKDAHEGKVWTMWEEGAAHRHPEALERWRNDLEKEIQAYKFWQFLFERDWRNLKSYCGERGIKIVGDIPIYVAHDSADVWAHRELFHLNENGDPTVVAGVPPDYFSKTGQLWGNPIYRWDYLADSGYRWWLDRFRRILTQVDVVRLDHFRGFEAYWEVPGGEDTAVNGRWIQGPGAALFDTLHYVFGELPIIAENLGLITPEVEALRMRFSFPGMAISQFAFGSDTKNPYLPHNFTDNIVAYSGTHDNDTTVGWWNDTASGSSTRSKTQIKKEREFVKKYLNTDGSDIAWDVIRALMVSVADTVIFPLQDILSLGGEARMNQPGRPSGNWQWRYTQTPLPKDAIKRLREMTEIYGRSPEQEAE